MSWRTKDAERGQASTRPSPSHVRSGRISPTVDILQLRQQSDCRFAGGSTALPYHVVFDVGTAGLQAWPQIQIGLEGVAIGVVLMLLPRKFIEALPWFFRRPMQGIFKHIFFGLSVLWTLIVWATSSMEYEHFRYALATRSCRQVEGVVGDFVPMPYDGHGYESFSVGAVRFQYSDFMYSGGFNNTASHGGPIRPGLQVRVCYLPGPSDDENVILRLEAAGL